MNDRGEVQKNENKVTCEYCTVKIHDLAKHLSRSKSCQLKSKNSKAEQDAQKNTLGNCLNCGDPFKKTLGGHFRSRPDCKAKYKALGLRARS